MTEVCLEIKSSLEWVTIEPLQTREFIIFFQQCTAKQSCYCEEQMKNLFLPDVSKLTQRFVKG